LLQVSIRQAKTQDYDKLEEGQLRPLNINPRLIQFINLFKKIYENMVHVIE